VETRVLIVDDEQNIRRTLSDILEEEGCEVATADSGEQAVELCGRHSFDYVVLDVRMPGMDGVEVFRHLRAAANDTPVILMSAYSVDQVQREALQEGALAFLRKPLDVEKLVGLIRGGADRPE
jgi:CheY-like chemotaxis protein